MIMIFVIIEKVELAALSSETHKAKLFKVLVMQCHTLRGKFYLPYCSCISPWLGSAPSKIAW